jgi:hypothetical protein
MRKQKTPHFIVLIVMALIESAIANTVPLWLGFTKGVILPSWSNMLWAINLSIAVRIVCNIVLAVRRPPRLYLALQAVTGAAGLLSISVFLIVYPLDFGAIGAGWVNTAIAVISVVGLALGTIGVIVNLARSIRGADYEEGSARA